MSEGRMVLDAARIAAGQRIVSEWVPIPEFGDGAGVFVRRMSGAQRDQWFPLAWVLGKDGQPEKPSALSDVYTIALCACDETGAPLFADVSPATIAAVNGMSYDVVSRIAKAAFRVNGLDVSAVDDAVKNSDAILGNASSGDSGIATDAPPANSSNDSTPTS